MLILKQAILFLQRNLAKSIVLGLSMLIIGILIFTISTVSMGINKLINAQLELYLPSAAVNLDFDKLNRTNNDTTQADVNATLTPEQINQIEQSDYWISTFNSSALHFLINPNNGLEEFMPTVIPYSGDSVEMLGNEESVVQVSGVDTPLHLTDEEIFTFNYLFSDQELSSKANIVILNDQYMKFNNLKIGDMINFGHTMYPLSDIIEIDLEDPNITWQDYEIVGSYTYKPSSDDISQAKENLKQSNFENPNSLLYYYYNLIYMPVTTVSSIKEELAQQYLLTNNITEEEMQFTDPIHQHYSVLDSGVLTSFKFDNIKNKDAFIQEIETVIAGMPNTIVKDLSDIYAWQYGSLATLSKYLSQILIATVLVSSILLSFIVVLFIHNRQKEFGILIALGQRRKKIYFQVILELGLLMIGGFIIAIPIGYYIAVLQVENLPFTMNAVFLLFFAGFLVTIFATLIPLLYMLRLNPKKILI